ncbi:MAG: DUF4062 domain-containing protein [Verrucomicrobiota bacterium]|nr:DUF4062 domain-containing protein [Verrucomicrobiota bacterium]
MKHSYIKEIAESAIATKDVGDLLYKMRTLDRELQQINTTDINESNQTNFALARSRIASLCRLNVFNDGIHNELRQNALTITQCMTFNILVTETDINPIISKDKKYQVFISSTYTDLKEERQAAVTAILKADHIPVGMELFPAGNNAVWETIKQWIDKSDIYMLILGARYGSIGDGNEYSYTEMEFRYAVEKKKPLFALVLHDEVNSKKAKLPHFNHHDIFERSNVAEYDTFRKYVLKNMGKFVVNTDQIQTETLASIHALSKEYDLVGWIRADAHNRIHNIDYKPTSQKPLKHSDFIDVYINDELCNTVDTIQLTASTQSMPPRLFENINQSLRISLKNKTHNEIQYKLIIYTDIDINLYKCDLTKFTSFNDTNRLEYTSNELMLTAMDRHVININLLHKIFKANTIGNICIDVIALGSTSRYIAKIQRILRPPTPTSPPSVNQSIS